MNVRDAEENERAPHRQGKRQRQFHNTKETKFGPVAIF